MLKAQGAGSRRKYLAEVVRKGSGSSTREPISVSAYFFVRTLRAKITRQP